MYEKVQNAIESNPRWLWPLIQLLAIPRYLERIADHATNIAEDVIYMIEGQIYRHVK
jgi:phosphate transport system protein